jgi:Poly A polymerase head domain
MKQVEIDFEYLDKLGSILNKVYFSTGKLQTFAKCAIAGGAIRDMLLHKPVNDIDVFYEGELSEKSLKNFFKTVKSSETNYPDGFNVTHTVTIESIPVPIQLIQVKNIQNHIDTFPTPMSRVWYSYENGLGGVDMDFVHQTINKQFLWDSKVDMPYYDKIKAKYSDWQHVFLEDSYYPYYEEEVEF